MRLRTLLCVALTMFALPALAAELPGALVPREMPIPVPPAQPAVNEDGPAICFEVRVIKIPAGFWRRAGVKFDGDLLSEVQFAQLMEAVQADRGAAIVQMPKVTVDDGQTARVNTRETRYFVTGVEATRVKGATVLAPKNTPVELGDSLDIVGTIADDGKSVRVEGKYTRVRVEGSVELVPVTTKITPVFEGGSQGKPVPFTQYLQAPEVRTEKAEKSATVPDGGTVVLGGWKECEPAAQGKAKKECEVVVLATARVLRAEPAPMPQPVPPPTEASTPVAPMPREASAVKAYPLTCAAAQHAAVTVAAHFEEMKNKGRVTFDVETNTVFVQADPAVQCEVSGLLAKLDEKAMAARNRPHVYQLRNVAAAEAALAIETFLKAKRLDAAVTAEPVSNTVLVRAGEELQNRIGRMLDGIDKAPLQVVMTVTVAQVPRGFAAEAGLCGDSGECCALSPREARMLTALLRGAKARGELEVLSRPMLQVADGQTGRVQIGQDYPVPGEPQIKLAGGAVPVERAVKFVPVGLSLKCTPRVAPGGQSIRLVTEFNSTEVKPGVTIDRAGALPPHARVASMPAFNTQSARTACDLRVGETMVLTATSRGGRSLTGAVRGHCAKDACETLVIITPHIVAGR